MLLTKVSADVPQVMIDGEMEKMTAQFKDDIAKAGVKMEDYLKQLGKSEEDIKKEWLPSAEKRVHVQLILSQIAKDEKIVPTEEDIKKEVDHLVSHYKDADRFRARMYVESVLTNEMVLRKLLGESTDNITTHNHQH
jgi:trigger factor